MSRVVFVAPFFAEATLRFLSATVSRPGTRTALVSVAPLEQLPQRIRDRLAGHWRVDDALDPAQLEAGVRGAAGQIGGVDRLLGVLEQLQVPLAVVRERLGIEGMGIEAARNFRDKSRMKTVLAGAGLPCARHRLCASGDEVRAFAREVGTPLVFKPPAGAGAKATFRVDRAGEIERAIEIARPRPSDPVLVEQFLTGKERSFDCVYVAGRPVWHSISRYLPTPLEVLENPWIQWCVLLPRDIDGREYDGIRQIGTRALDVLGLETGLAHMEWFELADGSVAISEVGARPPGAQIVKLTSFAHDFDLYEAWARLMVDGAFDPPERRWSAGAAFLRGQGRGRVKAVRGLDEAQREVGALVVESNLPRPGQPQPEGYEGAGWVLLRHRETAVVERALMKLIQTLRVELE